MGRPAARVIPSNRNQMCSRTGKSIWWSSPQGRPSDNAVPRAGVSRTAGALAAVAVVVEDSLGVRVHDTARVSVGW
jgi:hypothetical protein